MKSHKKKSIEKNRKYLITLVSLFVLVLGSYSIAIGSMTINAAESKETDNAIKEMRTEIASLEGSYYTMITNLSITQAENDGFKKDDKIIFAHINESTLVAYNN